MTDFNPSLHNYDFSGATASDDTAGIIPAGHYKAKITTIEKTVSKSGNSMIKVVYEIIGDKDGRYKGFKVFQNLVMEHSNPTVVQIANDNLKDIALACGVFKGNSLDLFKEIPIMVRLSVAKSNDANYGDSMRVQHIAKVDPTTNWIAEKGNSGAPQMPGMPSVPGVPQPQAQVPTNKIPPYAQAPK